MNRALFLLFLLAASCGPDEEAMTNTTAARPVGAVIRTKQSERALNQKTAAQQQGLYAQQAYLRPSTADDATATGTLSVTAGGAETAWVLSRLKGVFRQEAFDAVQFVVNYSTGSSITGHFAVVICRYEDDIPELLRVREVARGYLKKTVASPGAGGIREVVALSQQVAVSPGDKLALGIKFYATGAGTVSAASTVARAEALSNDAIAFDEAVAFDFRGIDQSSPVVQVGGNPVLLTLTTLSDSDAARNIKNWY